jgi:hypothetical protein
MGPNLQLVISPNVDPSHCLRWNGSSSSLLLINPSHQTVNPRSGLMVDHPLLGKKTDRPCCAMPPTNGAGGPEAVFPRCLPAILLQNT